MTARDISPGGAGWEQGVLFPDRLKPRRSPRFNIRAETRPPSGSTGLDFGNVRFAR